MSLEGSASDVATVQRALLEHLSALDGLGEHVAAAHLAAAIDALEDRIAAPATGHRRDSTRDPVEAMARGLIDMLGPEAQTAARGQIASATGSQRLEWAAIASRVDQLLLRCRTDAAPSPVEERGAHDAR